MFFPRFFYTFLLLAGAAAAPAAPEVNVWVTIPPQKEFVKRIAGDLAEVGLLVRPGQTPETYSPGAVQMSRLAKADLFFGIGMPIERALFQSADSALPGVRFVQPGLVSGAEEGAREEAREDGEREQEHHEGEHHEDGAHEDGDHGPGGRDRGDAAAGKADSGEARAHDGHAHANERDPHVWMDPQWVIKAVPEMCRALAGRAPGKETVFRENADRLVADLEELDEEIRERLAPYEGRAFFMNHPSLGHFAERYGLRQISLEQAGTEPSSKRLARLIRLGRREKVGAVLRQPEFGRTSAQTVARALGVDVVEVDPLARDYFATMRALSKRLRESFEKVQ